jgi:AcrR family transcriptional regulator
MRESTETSPVPPERDDVPAVAPGVFFQPPTALPRGRHALTREDVEAAQRERLLVAATELLAARGYRDVRVAAIAKRAHVSLTVFYSLFPDGVDQCLFAAYDRFIDVLLTRMAGAGEKVTDSAAVTVADLVNAIVPTYLTALQSDVVTARAFQVEMDAMGATARQRRRQALTSIAALLYDQHRQTVAAPLPPEAVTALVYGVRQLASDAIDTASVEGCDLPDATATTAWLMSFLESVT